MNMPKEEDKEFQQVYLKQIDGASLIEYEVSRETERTIEPKSKRDNKVS
jgi:hypothetical protein